MSVEALRRRLVLTTAAAKVANEVIGGMGDILHAGGRLLEGMADAAFLVEADAARQYQDLTGTDLGEIQGFPERYDGAMAEEVSFRDDDDDE